MTDNYDHFITRNIKAFYRKRLFSPIVYLVFLILLWIVFPLSSILFPDNLDLNSSLEQEYLSGKRYVSASFTNLTFTGYTSSFWGSTNGYYYYGTYGDECIIVLLTPSTCEEGLPSIDSIHIRAHLHKGGDSYRTLLSNLANDLSWTESGIYGQMPSYFVSEPDFNTRISTVLFTIYFASGLYALFCVIVYLIYIQFPALSPACQNLIVFGHPIRMLEEAEEELATLPQLATEDMFITEHYFIMTSPYGNAIVPINEILWIYKHSTLHKFLWYHFSISYTMHITANKHLYIHCPKNIKSDIDGIMDYLAEANHNILVGFSEENRLKVEAVLGKPFHIEKLHALLHKKI